MMTYRRGRRQEAPGPSKNMSCIPIFGVAAHRRDTGTKGEHLKTGSDYRLSRSCLIMGTTKGSLLTATANGRV